MNDAFNSKVDDSYLETLLSETMSKSTLVNLGYVEEVLEIVMETGDYDATITKLKALHPDDAKHFNRRNIKNMFKAIKDDVVKYMDDIRIKKLIKNIEESKILSIKKREYIQSRMVENVEFANSLATRIGEIKDLKLVNDMYMQILEAIDGMDKILGIIDDGVANKVDVNIDNREVNILDYQRNLLKKRLGSETD